MRFKSLKACAAIASAAMALGQQKPQEPEAAFRTHTRLVVCHATVVDRDGRLVTGLPQSAFRVYENEVPQTIKVFQREDVPVSLGLVIDNSASMRDHRRKVTEAALDLVKASNPQDEIFVVNFNDQAYLDLPNGKDFTSDPRELEEALGMIDSSGGTAMRDAIALSIDHLRTRARRDKKVLVVITDGRDNSSTISPESLVKAAQQSGVLIYSVGLLALENARYNGAGAPNDQEREEITRARNALRDLATATGGESYFPGDLAEVDRIAYRVARDIRNQYTIAYTPANQEMDSSYRKIRIVVNAPGGLTVRTRSGYFATPEQPSRRP